jgi:hypothetical protein
MASITLGFGPNYLTAANVSPYLLKDRSVRYTKSVNNSWTASFTMRDINGDFLAFMLANGLGDSTGRPIVGQPFWLWEDTTLLFGGMITQITEQAWPADGNLRFFCSCSGWSVVTDHRTVTATYPEQSIAYNVVVDIVNTALAGEGIDITPLNNQLLGLLPQPLTFNPATVTDAFNQIRTLTGEQWWIDETKGLHFRHPENAQNSNVVISDNSHNWIDGSIQVQSSAKQFRNVQYEMTALPVSTTARVESFTAPGGADGLGWWFITKFAITSAPTVTVNGTPQTIYEFGVDAYGQDGWYWTNGVWGVQQGQQIAPTAGSTIVVSYDALANNYSVQENAASIAARSAIEGTSGRWEHIDSGPNLQTGEVADAYALANLSTFGTIPQEVKFDTYLPGLSLGTYLVFALTLHNLFGHWVITDISAVEEPGAVVRGEMGSSAGSTVRYSVKCTNEQNIGGYINWFQGISNAIKNAADLAAGAAAAAAQNSNLQPLSPINPKATFNLIGGPWDSDTDLTTHDIVRVSGQLVVCTAQAKTAPSGGDAEFEIAKSSDNGTTWVTLFGDTKLTIPDGSTDVISFTDFVGAGSPDFTMTVAAGDLLRIDMNLPGNFTSPLMSTTGPSNVTIVLEWSPF